MPDIITIHQGPAGILWNIKQKQKKKFFFFFYCCCRLAFSSRLLEPDLHTRAIPWKALKQSVVRPFPQQRPIKRSTRRRQKKSHDTCHRISSIKDSRASFWWCHCVYSKKEKKRGGRPWQPTHPHFGSIVSFVLSIFCFFFTSRCPVGPQVRVDLVVIQDFETQVIHAVAVAHHINQHTPELQEKWTLCFFRLKIQLKLEQRYWTSFSINRLTTTIIPPRPTQSNHYPCQKGGKKREIRYEVKKRWIRRRRTRSYDVYRKSYLTDQSSSLGDGQGLGRNWASNASHLFVVVAVFDVTHGSFELTLNRFWEDRCKGLLEIRVFRRPGTVSWLG